jgi:hypothetical protein
MERGLAGTNEYRVVFIGKGGKSEFLNGFRKRQKLEL